ncbi:unnamed protein product [Merluccius merluccius]
MSLQAEVMSLRAEVTRLREALQEKEVENARIRTDLMARGSSPVQCQGGSSQVVLKEMGSRPDLHRKALHHHQRGSDPSGFSSNQVRQYLRSLASGPLATRPVPLPAPGADQSGHGVREPHPEAREDDCCTSVSAGGGASVSAGGGASGAGLERWTSAPLREVVTSSSGDESFQNVLQLLQRSNSLIAAPRLHQSHGSPTKLGQSRDAGRDPQLDTSLARCEVESVRSGWSGSTFNTRDEVEFCSGLVALDASIASLQKTIQKDLVT